MPTPELAQLGMPSWSSAAQECSHGSCGDLYHSVAHLSRLPSFLILKESLDLHAV